MYHPECQLFDELIIRSSVFCIFRLIEHTPQKTARSKHRAQMSVRLPKQSENNWCQFRNGWPCCRKTGTQENRTAHTKAERKPARDRDRGKLKDRRLIDMPAVGAARRERKCIYAAESTSVWVMGFSHPAPSTTGRVSLSLLLAVYAKSRTIPILSGWRHASFYSSVAVWVLLFNSLIRSVLQLWISLVRWYLFKFDIQFSLAQSINELEYANNRTDRTRRDPFFFAAPLIGS